MKQTFKHTFIKTFTYSGLILTAIQPFANISPVFAEPNDIMANIEALEEEEQSIQELLEEQSVSLDELMAMIAEKEEDVLVLIAEIEEKEEELIELRDEIDGKETEIGALTEEMEAVEAELAVTMKKYDRNIEIAKSRFQNLQIEEKNPIMVYIEAVLNSESFIDVFSRISAVSKILGAHSDLLESIQEQANDIETLQGQISLQQRELKIEQTALESMATRVQSEQDNLLEEHERAETLIAEFEAERAAVEDAYEDNVDALYAAQETLDGQRLLQQMHEAEQRRLGEEQARQAEVERANQITEEEDATVSVASSRQSTRNALSRIRNGQRDADKVEQILSVAEGYIGVPYVWGGSTPSGFDCSGLVQDVYRSVGINLPRTSAQQATQGTAIAVSDAQPGDLLYWDRDGQVYHVAIYIGGGEYIHAPRPGRTVGVASVLHFTPSSARRVVPNAPQEMSVSSSSTSKVPSRPSTPTPSDNSLIGSFEATAYAVGDGLTPSTVTANGTNVANTIHSPEGHRIIAVDTNVIPMDSIVRVELPSGESFLAKASDTGGAINGRKIDLLVNSPQEARRFGRQSGIKIYSTNQ